MELATIIGLALIIIFLIAVIIKMTGDYIREKKQKF
jgi:hypothetical protein